MIRKTILLILWITLSYMSTAYARQNMETFQNEEIVKFVLQNNLQAVERLLKTGTAVNTRGEEGRSLLLLATREGLADMAKLLVSFDANVNQQDDIGDSPFLYAGATGQTELVKLFLANGARFNIFNRYNGTALIPACERGHIETVRLLAQTKGFQSIT